MKAGKEVVRDPVDPKEELKENLIAVGIVILILMGSAWWIYTRITAPLPDAPPVEVPVGGSPTIGTNESMTVVLFSDFECPYCADFAREEFPRVKALAEQGRIRFVFKQFPLDSHPRAFAAAQASLCADEQGRFWEYHDVLYENNDALSDEDLARYAAELGLDAQNFASCFAASADQVTAEKRLGQGIGVAGTPTFFFNGKKVAGAITYEEFVEHLD